MAQTLEKIAETLRDAKNVKRANPEQVSDVKVQLIYAFNGVGKTRLSREFKELIAPKEFDEEEQEETGIKTLYYNAFTEDIFYWDNDLDNDTNRKLIIRPNSFTNWVLEEQGQELNIIRNFQHYTSDKLTPKFNEEYTTQKDGRDIVVKAFSEVTFSFERGNNDVSENIKISKGEESNFVWSVFYSFLEEIVSVLNEPEIEERTTNQFNNLQYVFIDDPVSSLDDNHLIELAVDLASLIKSSRSELKFIITTHNPLFYNVLFNEFKKPKFKKYLLKKLDNGEYELKNQNNDSPFSYHLHVFSILREMAISGNIEKYHFNLLRNVLEKLATFLNYEDWGELISNTNLGDKEPYVKRILNITSHSKHSGNESRVLQEPEKRIFKRLVKEILKTYNFNIDTNNIIIDDNI